VETACDTRASRLATRLAFLVAGFGIACWAPLVPYVKESIGADEAELGTLLLCLGLGSVLAMPLAGALSARIGSRPVIIASGIGMALVLPFLSIAPTMAFLAGTLMFFGAFLGALDVAANIHATEVQALAGVPLMSNFHGFYSIGGLIGAGFITALLSLKVAPLPASASACALMLVAMIIAIPGLLRSKPADEGTPFFVVPHGITILIGILAFILFLLEGAVLDWSAVILSEVREMPKNQAGIGYTLFALAMTVGRLTGDFTINRLGGSRVLILGSLVTVAGVALIVFIPPPLGLAGFVLIGAGAANLVPLLFTAAGNQGAMPASHAIAAISIMGYAGVLLGPALVGFLGKAIGLMPSFGLVGMLVLLVAIFARKVGRI